jgi:hypothetical protein
MSGDYVLGEPFLATFNPLFVITYAADGTVEFTVMMKNGSERVKDNTLIIVVPILSVFLIVLATVLTMHKA